MSKHDKFFADQVFKSVIQVESIKYTNYLFDQIIKSIFKPEK